MATVRIPFDSTTNKDLLKTGSLRKIFDTTVREAKSEYSILFNDLKTSDEYERDVRMAGLEEAVKVVEGQNIPVQTPRLGATKTYTQELYGAGFRMTFKFDYFNKYNLWKRWAKDLAKIQIETKDITVADVFNTPASYTGFDTLVINSTAHTALDAATSTYDNYGSAAAMSVTSVQAARYYFSMLIDDMGKWMGAIPTILYFEPTLYFTANEIFGSELIAHELSNTINVLPKMNLKLFEYHRLSGTTKWGMAAPQDDKYDYNVFTSLEPRMFEKDAPDNTLDKVMISLQMFDYDVGDPRLVYFGI